MEYRVIWEIDIEADTPAQAAKMAHAMQRDPASWATVAHRSRTRSRPPCALAKAKAIELVCAEQFDASGAMPRVLAGWPSSWGSPATMTST